MKYFKVSYSSDSLEGLNSLAGLSASIQSSDSNINQGDISPPPDPDKEDLETDMFGQNVVVSPPLLDDESSSLLLGDRSEIIPPPEPLSLGTEVGNGLSMDSGNVSPPPSPEDEGALQGDSFTQPDVGLPPEPNALSLEAENDQNEGDVEPPPAPVTRKPRSSKK